MGRWSNVHGTAYVSTCWDELIEEENPHGLQLLFLEAVLKENNNVKINPEEEFKSIEIEINFSSSGYYTEAKTYGPPEDCYPEEGDEERELISVEFSTENYKIVADLDLANRLFVKYNNAVNRAEIDYNYESDFEPYDYGYYEDY